MLVWGVLCVHQVVASLERRLTVLQQALVALSTLLSCVLALVHRPASLYTTVVHPALQLLKFCPAQGNKWAALVTPTKPKTPHEVVGPLGLGGLL